MYFRSAHSIATEYRAARATCSRLRLAAATRADSSLQWIGARPFRCPLACFEVEIAPPVLNERPRQTSIDWLVLNRDEVVAAEAKFTESPCLVSANEPRRARHFST